MLVGLLVRRADVVGGGHSPQQQRTVVMAVASIRRRPLSLVVQERVPLALPERTVLTM